MLKKISLIYLLLITVNLFSVFLYSCRCKTDKARYCIDLQSIGVTVKDNGGLDPQPVFNSSVYAKALILSVSINEVRYQCSHTVSPMFNAAYAMCKERQDNRWYNAAELHIFMDRDYDQAHPAGTDIKDLFLQRGNDYYLMSAPEDTSGTYRFIVQLAYEKLRYPPLRTDTMTAFTSPLKLKK